MYIYLTVYSGCMMKDIFKLCFKHMYWENCNKVFNQEEICNAHSVTKQQLHALRIKVDFHDGDHVQCDVM
jgi:hypothetical protein